LIRAFLVALQFLTRLPVRLSSKPSENELGRSACAYPWVGLLLGFITLLAYAPVADLDSAPVAFLVLILLVLSSGGLHLDGLADTADAWVGGQGDREATLRIMKDPAVGAMGVIALIMVLIGKFACFEVLLRTHHWQVLLIVPVIGRGALLALLLTTPYVRAAGLGSAVAEHLPKRLGGWSLAAAAVLVLALQGGGGVAVLGVAVLVLWALQRAFVRRLGGVTGDTLGAACEIVELAVLGVLALGAGL